MRLSTKDCDTMLLALAEAIRWEVSIIDAYDGAPDESSDQVRAACNKNILKFQALHAKIKEYKEGKVG